MILKLCISFNLSFYSWIIIHSHEIWNREFNYIPFCMQNKLRFFLAAQQTFLRIIQVKIPYVIIQKLIHVTIVMRFIRDDVCLKYVHVQAATTFLGITLLNLNPRQLIQVLDVTLILCQASMFSKGVPLYS